jgi:hypothetical protein
VELGAEDGVEDGAAVGLDADDSPADDAAGLSEDFVGPLSEGFLESDFESDAESLALEEESDELESLEESLELEPLGA